MSLATLRAAVRARLDTLLTTASPAGPFALVANWAGEYERVSADGPGFAALGEMPAALIAFAREMPTQSKPTTTGELFQMLGTIVTVFVVACETGAPSEATGLLDDLIDAVMDAVAGTRVGSTTLMFESWAPHRVRPGLYCYAVNFRATRALGTRPAAGETVPLVRVDAEVNPVDADPDDDAALPLAWAQADELNDPPDP